MQGKPQSDRVLVLDGDMTPSLAIARSLGRIGIDVVIASHAAKPIASYSRHVSRTIVYPDPLLDAEAFTAWGGSQLATGGYRLIIPVTERTLVPMLPLLDLPGGERIAAAPPEALEIALDKHATLSLADRLEIPVPRSRLIQSSEDLLADGTALQPPYVLKPRRSISTHGARREQLQVEYANSIPELRYKLARLLECGEVLVQEWIPGDGIGVDVLVRHGELVHAFQHRRLHEVPLSGGGSSLRVSEGPAPTLLNCVRKLMHALQWHGVAMVEFKVDRDSGRFALMEINGRFWGSLPLAIAAGADFPVMLYELLTTGNVRAADSARHGVYARKLSSDLIWHKLKLRDSRRARSRTVSQASAVLGDWLQVFSRHHHFDVQQWRDPLPGLVDLARITHAELGRVMCWFSDRLARTRQRWAWRPGGELQQRLQKGGLILFVCYGNINRSPIAERYFQRRNLQPRLRASSAGLHQESGRHADPQMVAVVLETGLDMRDWASRCLTEELVGQSSVILAMELNQLHQIKTCYPQAADRCFLLAAGDTGRLGKGDIQDPYGKDEAVYRNVRDQVFACVERLLVLTEQNTDVS